MAMKTVTLAQAIKTNPQVSPPVTARLLPSSYQYQNPRPLSGGRHVQLTPPFADRVRIKDLIPSVIHPKLIVSDPNDSNEVEADQMADKVMTASEPRTCYQSRPISNFKGGGVHDSNSFQEHIVPRMQQQVLPTASKVYRMAGKNENEPHPAALHAASNAMSMLDQREPKIWFDSWYNDRRDNNDNEKYDEDDQEERANEGHDGAHYRGGGVWTSGANVRRGIWPITWNQRIPANSIKYKVCVDVVNESYKSAGINLGTRSVAGLENYCTRSNQFRTWREDRGEEYPELAPGDIITYKTNKHSHSGIVGTNKQIIHLPGPSNWLYFNNASSNDMESTWETVWRTFFGITQISRPVSRRKSAVGRNKIQRQASSCSEQTIVPQEVLNVISTSGQPLDSTAKTYMESRFGLDFSHVRVHIDAAAEKSAEAINAMAYTVGRDVVFGAGQYKPHDLAGRRLIAHELTHVIQGLGSVPQNSAISGNKYQTDESEAIQIAARIIQPEEGVRCSLPKQQIHYLNADKIYLNSITHTSPVLLPVPNWDQLPSYAQGHLGSRGRGYGKEWFERQDDNLRLTVLNLFVKLRGMGLWDFIVRESGTTNKGNLEFIADVSGLKNALTGRDEFTNPEKEAGEWSSREKHARGSLHFKHFEKWDKNKVQAHIDQEGLLLRSPWWWLIPPIPITQALSHGFNQDSYLDVKGIRTILLDQGWDPSVLKGVAPAKLLRKSPTVPKSESTMILRRKEARDSKIEKSKLKQHKYICGPDITDALSDVLTDVRNTFQSKWNDNQKRKACDTLTEILPIPRALEAWEIYDLWGPTTSWLRSSTYSDCGIPRINREFRFRDIFGTDIEDPKHCGNTVRVGGTCYLAGTVNYVIFGQMCRLCFDKFKSLPESEMTKLIWKYKQFIPFMREDPGPPTAWALAGYRGFPGQRPSTSNRPRCRVDENVRCPPPRHRFSWKWLPYKE